MAYLPSDYLPVQSAHRMHCWADTRLHHSPCPYTPPHSDTNLIRPQWRRRRSEYTSEEKGPPSLFQALWQRRVMQLAYFAPVQWPRAYGVEEALRNS